MRRHPFVRRATALVLSWVVTVNTMLWAAPPSPPAPGPPKEMTPYLPGLTPLALLQQALTEMAWSPPAYATVRPVRRGTAGESTPIAELAKRFETETLTAEPLAAATPLTAGIAEPVLEPAALEPASPPSATAAGLEVPIFGPQRYVRTSGAKNVYTTNVSVPAWVTSPYRMEVINGEPDGTFRISSAWIEVNGAQVADPDDFHQNVPGLNRSVTLTPQTTLVVTLASNPTSYLTINLYAESADLTAPRLTVDEPAPGITMNDPTPRLLVKYQDEAGAGEPAASGVDPSTLHVFLDGVDRTGLFTKRSDEASAELPESLALDEGPHRLEATIADRAGNLGQASSDFVVDRTLPAITVVEPAAGSYLATATPVIRVRYGDNLGLDLASLGISINGVDRTSLFTIGPEEAVAALDAASALPNGPNQVVAQIQDHGGNRATASTSFNVDVLPPTLTIASPAEGARLGNPDVELNIQYADDQGLDLASFRATVDGAEVSLATGPDGATGTVGPLGDGLHTLEVGIHDRAGNLTTASASFYVDTSVPDIAIRSPAAGSILASAEPDVEVTYSDNQGVDTATLEVMVNGTSRTDRFIIGADTATATLSGDASLPEGETTILAEVDDLAGNTGSATSTFTVDTIPPTGVIEEPEAYIREETPTVRVRYSDAGVGVNPEKVLLFIDGVDRTGLFAVGSDGATGVLDSGLADGEHEVRLVVEDRAGNAASFLHVFTVDTVLPLASFATPANDSFINDTTPLLRLTYDDGTGTGVDLASVRIFLRRGDEPEVDITASLQMDAAEAVGEISEALALAEGTHHLRATLSDLAGNAAEARSAFAVDTVAPTFSIVAPAASGFVPTATPFFEIHYEDDQSGVDSSRLVLRVDGVDRTERLTVEETRATGALAPEDALAEGEHQVEVIVMDRAGNTAAPVPHVFTVDTIDPVAAVELPPNGALLASPDALVRFAYDDPAGSGVDPGSVRIEIDGVDRTLEFAVTAGAAEATLPFGDGSHTAFIEVLDFAANPASAASTFVVDTQPPLLGLVAPPESSYHRESPVALSGTVQDADPQTTVQCSAGGVTVDAVLTVIATSPLGMTEWSFACDVPLVEGTNAVEVVATDRSGHQASAERSLILDTIPPDVTVVQPAEGEYTMAQAVEVSGGVVDASPVTVRVEGPETVPATVDNTAFNATVSLGSAGDGEEIVLRVVAEDAAGNLGEDTVTVRVDRTSPVVQITSPADGAFLKSPVTVTGTVTDVSPVVLVEVNGSAVTPNGDTFSTQLAAADGPLAIQATAHDAAGNIGTDAVNVIVDSTPPVILVSSPPEGLITRDATLVLAGTVTDVSPVTLTLGGNDVPLAGDSFSVEVPLAAEGANTLALVATDAAGNVGSRDVVVIRDTTPPALDVVSPAPNAVVGDLPALVQGFVHDATETVVTVDGVEAERMQDAWQISFASLAEGPHTFDVVATDAAGNETRVARTVLVDLGPPLVTILSPAAGTLTSATAIDVTGTVADLTSVEVSVNGVPATLSGSGTVSFTAVQVPLVDGDNLLRAVATDAAGRTGEAEVVVTQDAIPPLVELTTPEVVSRTRGGTATASVTDNLAVAEVTLKINGVVVASFTEPPYEIELTVPEGVATGDTLTVTAEAVDTAGNTASASRGVRVIADGVIVGQVLSDVTSLPLEEASVQLGETIDVTDARGRYSLPASEAQIVLVVEKEEMTSVEREVSVASGVGTVPVDARLTPLAPPQTLGADGGALEATLPGTTGMVSVEVPPGALSAPTAFRLTSLSAQGLPGLLPLGWSPLAAFDLRTTTPANLADLLSVTMSGLPSEEVHLVMYRPAAHAWLLVSPYLLPVDGSLTVSLEELGAYALVAPDFENPDVVVPEVGEPLSGVEMELLPASVTSTGAVDPPVMPPTGGIAWGTLSIFSPIPMPSGTVIQAKVTETFTLASGDIASEETRLEDIVLFQKPVTDEASLGASFPIAPSRTFETTELVEGKVHLDILAGREGVRGKTGGNEALTIEQGETKLIVPALSLDEDTAISMEPVALSDFLPSSSSLVPLSEVVVDLSGETLGMSAELSVELSGIPEGSTLLIARVERIGGVPRMTVVGAAELVAGRVVSREVPGLAGVRRGGRYVFYRSAVPVGFVGGITSSSSGTSVKAVAETAGLPFVAVSDAEGRYVVAALTGAVLVTATVPGTSLAGSGTAHVTAGEVAGLDVVLAGTVTTATVSPADGAVAVPRNLQVDITTTAAINSATATAEHVKLFQGLVADNQPVAVRLVLSGSGKHLAVIPETALEPSTLYTLDVTGLADLFGGLVSVPSVSFTTKSDTAPVYDTSQLSFSLPDDNGLVQVTAPPGTVPAGTTVLIVNAGNGVVLSLTAGNDGSVTGELPASIRDRLLVTITDPLGNVTSFERSKFVGPDGTTAIGPGGGVVEGPGGVEVRIPPGAVDEGVVLKITSFDETFFPAEERPELSTAEFGSGLTIEASEPASFDKEVDLVFAKPEAAPEGAFYYVYRRLEGPPGADGEPIVSFETIDQAFVEGEGDEAKVVTASYPFGGYTASFGLFSLTGFLGTVTTVHTMLMWSFDALRPGKAQTGVITGRVLRTVLKPGSASPEFVGIPNVLVTGADAAGNPLLGEDNTTVAITQEDGTYTLWDERFTGGTVKVSAFVDGEVRTATAFEVDVETLNLPGLQHYENVATANITFPAVAPPPPPPPIVIRVMEEVEGRRQLTDGLVVEQTPLLLGFSSPAEVTGAAVEGEALTVRRDPLFGQDPLGMDFIAEFTPAAAGSYRVTATALPAFGGPVTASSTFRVIAAGGSNNDPVPDQPPEVITVRTVPKDTATGVPVTIFPQVTFTEPVRNLPGNVSLVDEGGEEVSFLLSGVGPSGPTEDVTAERVLTSVTIQPLTGLKFGTTYTLSLTGGIEDLDVDGNGDPAPRSLVPFESSFRTFGPEPLGGTDEKFGSAGMVVLGDRAYLVENHFFTGTLRAYDITDPVEPQEIVSAQNSVTGRPVDVAGEEGTVVVATSSTNRSLPSNLWVFDVTSDAESRWVGAASVANSAVEGFVQRVEVFQGLAYTLTGRRGVQIVDLGKAVSNFDVATGGQLFTSGYWDMVKKLNTSGQGFGQSAVAQTIPLKKPDNSDYFLNDLAVAQVQGQTLVAVTGEAPLLLVNPALGQPSPPAPIQIPEHNSELTFGNVIALGQLGERDVAVVVGFGKVNDGPRVQVLAVVDLSNPEAPFTMSIIEVPLEGTATDILLTEDLAIVAGQTEAALVNLTNPSQPKFAGTIDMVGGVLALDTRGILYSTARSVFGGETEGGGVRTAALARTPVIRHITSAVIVRPSGVPTTHKDITIEFDVVPKDVEVTAGEVQILRDGTLLETLAAQLKGSNGVATWPAGRTVQHGATYTARAVVDPGTEREAESAEKVIPLADVTLEVSPDTETDVSADDGFAYVTAQVFYQDPDDSENQVPVDDGAEIRWEIQQGSGSLSPTTSFTRDGLAATLLRTSTRPGESYVVKGRLIRFEVASEEFTSVQEKFTAPLVVVPGAPSTITLTPSKSTYRSDGTDTVDFVAEIRDSVGNLVADGTDVAWSVDESVTQFQSVTTATINGHASATLLAPILPVDQVVEARSGFASATTTVDVRRVTGELTSTIQNLDIAEGETATITALVQASDGTPVEWFATNGTLIGEPVVSGGVATATLSAAGGRLGTVVVIATIGDRLLHWQGEFYASSGLVVGAERPVLVGDAESDGVETVVWPDGSIHEVPFWTSTPVFVQGPPNSTATVSLPGTQPVEAFTFDEMTAGVITGSIAGHEMLVAGASLDTTIKHAGVASLLFDGDDEASLADSPALEFADAFDVSFWVNPEVIRQATLISKGSWSVHLLGDGRLQGQLTTTAGTFSITNNRQLEDGVWSFVSLQLQSGILRLSVDSSTEFETQVGGVVDTDSEPIVLGTGFQGHLDDLMLSQAPGSFSLVRLNGIDAVGQFPLGPDGRGSFEVSTRGLLPSGTERASVTIKVSVNPEDEDVVVIEQKTLWVYVSDTFIAFFGGDPETGVGIASNIAGGMLIVGDIGSLVKNGWRLTGWSSKEPNALEASLSGLGLLTEIAVGAGEVADAPVSTGRAIVARIGNSPLARIIYKRIKTAVTKGVAIAEGETAFLKAIASGEGLLDVFNAVAKSDEAYEASLRLFEKLGPDFLTFVKNIATDPQLGVTAATRAISVLGDASDTAIASLKASPKLADGLLGLAKILRQGVDPQLVGRVISNCADLKNICTAAYTAGHLLDDIGDLASVKGIEDLLKMLKTRNVQAAGFRYELEVAVFLQRKGVEIVELTKRVAVVLEEGADVVKTDIDIVVREAGELVYYQAKRSRDAVGFGKRGLDGAKEWVAKALADLRTTDVTRIKYVLPDGLEMPPQVRKWFAEELQGLIEIVRVPHL